MVFGKPELTAAKDGGGGNNVDVTGKLEAGTGVVGIKGIGMIPGEQGGRQDFKNGGAFNSLKYNVNMKSSQAIYLQSSQALRL